MKKLDGFCILYKNIPECANNKRSDKKNVSFVECREDDTKQFNKFQNYRSEEVIKFADVYFMCTAILDNYGFENQCAKTIEKCNELCFALHHRENIYEREVIIEIADVLIMCLQLASHYGFDAVKDEIKYKLERQIDRINKEEI